MRAKFAGFCLSILAGMTACSVQAAPQAASSTLQPDYSFVNCSGFVTDQKVGDEMRIVSGEQSDLKIQFSRGDYVHINRGLDKGVRVGDRFSVVRPDKDALEASWFKWQTKLMKAMGTAYVDAGQIRVINVQPKVSIAEVIFSCGDPMQRGDILVPFQDRPAPPFKDPAAFDHFAPVSGKPVAMVVTGAGFHQISGRNDSVYVNLGTAQGVKVGDYFRIFRYQGSTAALAPNTKDVQYKVLGFGSAPVKYQWNDLPREVVGEGIVLNTSHNSSTVLITYSTLEVYAGDYVEIE